MKKYLMFALILIMLVACGPSQRLQPPATRRVVRPTAKPTIDYAALEALFATPVPDAPSMILKMHESDFDFWMDGNGNYQWRCENELCGCMFPPSVKSITCGMTYDNPYVTEFEMNSASVFLIFGVPDDAIVAVHDAQIQARVVPAGVLVEVSGSVRGWEWRYKDDPNDRTFNTTFWIIQGGGGFYGTFDPSVFDNISVVDGRPVVIDEGE